VLVAVLVIPTIAAVAVSWLQLSELLDPVRGGVSDQTASYLNNEVVGQGGKQDIDELHVEGLIALDYDVLVNRENMVRAFLATHAWLQFTTFPMGAVLTLVGCAFVLGRVEAESSARAQGTSATSSFGWELITQSPGIVFVLAGVFLITVPHWLRSEIFVEDASTFFDRYPPMAAAVSMQAAADNRQLRLDVARRRACVECASKGEMPSWCLRGEE
jgi:hypothetical protein